MLKPENRAFILFYVVNNCIPLFLKGLQFYKKFMKIIAVVKPKNFRYRLDGGKRVTLRYSAPCSNLCNGH